MIHSTYLVKNTTYLIEEESDDSLDLSSNKYNKPAESYPIEEEGDDSLDL